MNRAEPSFYLDAKPSASIYIDLLKTYLASQDENIIKQAYSMHEELKAAGELLKKDYPVKGRVLIFDDEKEILYTFLLGFALTGNANKRDKQESKVFFKTFIDKICEHFQQIDHELIQIIIENNEYFEGLLSDDKNIINKSEVLSLANQMMRIYKQKIQSQNELQQELSVRM